MSYVLILPDGRTVRTTSTKRFHLVTEYNGAIRRAASSDRYAYIVEHFVRRAGHRRWIIDRNSIVHLVGEPA